MPKRILSDIQMPDFNERPPKQGDILRTAEALFMQFGYNKVTVEEICREARVSKVTFYKYFPNKFAVLKDYLDARLKVGMETFERIRTADVSLQEKMQAMIAMKESAVSQFSPVFIQSLYSGDPAVQELMENWTVMGMNAMRKFFEDGQKSGEIFPGYSIDFLLHVWTVLSEDVKSNAVSGIYGDDYVKLSQDFMNFLFYGTTGPAGKG